MVSPNRKVAIVGIGGVFPNCKDLSDFKQRLFAGESFIREWDETLLYGSSFRSKVSGFIDPKDISIETAYCSVVEGYAREYIDTLNRIPAGNMATSDMSAIGSMLGALGAIEMAGWTESEIQSEQTGVVIGTNNGGHALERPAWKGIFEKQQKTRLMGAHSAIRVMVYREAANVSGLIKNKGVCESIGSACATGLGNIGYAYRLIKFGLQDRAIAGGSEGNSIETFAGLDAMGVLSRGFNPEESSRPFDKDRKGLVCSFGSGVVALEEYEMAKARGANILAVIDSYFNNVDGDGDLFFPSFSGQKRLWKGMLDQHPVRPDVVKVHGTSTRAGDPVELFSVVDVLGDQGYHISAPKSQFGHTLGAAGAIELITAVMMLQEQKVLPCLNANNFNTELEPLQRTAEWDGPNYPINHYKHLISNKIVEKEINQIVCLNYGFGGANSAMSISKPS
ncbi:beta-ketoacyl synthase [Pedobacter sp. LMG 31464]|uniref:Beta-ketoacyl synthase n=1 Tax=Pedobacter planticolens TaxID=2679964 RepID=A0A923DZK2_9SPHI|nr:beta-ketoacyl synthase N-terminal-like domain-containing protein [Pedobacter planticolens]MBB2146972.1 beta-ketoacyl synthase [Pedobacter planticolens]